MTREFGGKSLKRLGEIGVNGLGELIGDGFLLLQAAENRLASAGGLDLGFLAVQCADDTLGLLDDPLDGGSELQSVAL